MGWFSLELLFFGTIGLITVCLLFAMTHKFVQFLPSEPNKKSVPSHDYSHISQKQRIFYELIGDTILTAYSQTGQKAFDIAAKIEGLTINTDTGKVTDLSGSPPRILAHLITSYESELGKRVDLLFRQPALIPARQTNQSKGKKSYGHRQKRHHINS